MSRGLLTPRRGTHLIIDDIDGFKIRSDKARIDWRGFVMSEGNFSEKHPQLDLRGRSEQINVTPTRTRPVDKFVTSVDPDSLNGKT